jgi:hypothetical protein
MTAATPQPSLPTEAEERAITREVLLVIAALHPLKARDGRIVIPDGASEELVERIGRVEGELLWARGYESGPRWGCAWVPARPPTCEEASMKIERRRLTKAELASVTSRRPVVRRIPAPDKADSPGPNAPGPQGPVESTVTYNTSR